jgi:hypothetical protein
LPATVVEEQVEQLPPSSNPVAPPEPVDAVGESARSTQARRGLSTKSALLERVARTRQLLILWAEVGKYLGNSERRLDKPEARELIRLLSEVENALQDFPLMGEAGQAGYMVVALTQLSGVRPIVSLAPSQRESLERDWNAGQKFLLSHRELLREEIRAMRRRTFQGRLIRTVRAYLNEQPGAALLLILALFALGIAIWRANL